MKRWVVEAWPCQILGPWATSVTFTGWFIQRFSSMGRWSNWWDGTPQSIAGNPVLPKLLIFPFPDQWGLFFSRLGCFPKCTAPPVFSLWLCTYETAAEPATNTKKTTFSLVLVSFIKTSWTNQWRTEVLKKSVFFFLFPENELKFLPRSFSWIPLFYLFFFFSDLIWWTKTWTSVLCITFD